MQGRRSKANQFADAFATVLEFADEPGDVSDACVTLAVHAGIARHLKTLLDVKTLAGYSSDAITLASLKKAGRAMTALVNAARRSQ